MNALKGEQFGNSLPKFYYISNLTAALLCLIFLLKWAKTLGLFSQSFAQTFAKILQIPCFLLHSLWSAYWCMLIHVGSLHDQYTQHAHQWQVEAAETPHYLVRSYLRQIQILEILCEICQSVYNLVCDAMHFETDYHLEVLSYTSSVGWMQYACAQKGTRRALYALLAPLIWVQFALLWIFAVGMLPVPVISPHL